jgi:hypothetical protein
MSDKIREAAEKWVQSLVKKGYSSFDPCDMGEAYITGAASRDDEISELVEALDKAGRLMSLEAGDTDNYNSSKLKSLSDEIYNLISLYTKTPCPECGGEGYYMIAGDRVSGTMCDHVAVKKSCPDCQGRGYKWERKG